MQPQPQNQLSIFDCLHAPNLRRVRSKLEPDVEAFFLAHSVGFQFTALSLWQFVNARHACAPDSPRRVMSEMATEGRLGYEVINRRQSLYRITALPEVKEKEAA